MAIELYKPFERLNFSKQNCFLSGEKLQHAEEEIHVFPQWLMQEYKLHDKQFKLLDESISTYSHLKLPCTTSINRDIIEVLEKEIKEAFLKGYDAVSKLSDLKLFQWIAKMVYGILFNEIRIGIMQQKAKGEEFIFSQSLVHKFGNLHMMLQSLTKPIEFEGNYPWTIKVFKIASKQDFFNYRDEINTLTYSLAMKDFGIIACLQDNGTNGIYHKDILEKVKGKSLHPAQFEEICAKFYYSNYLFNRLPEYTIMTTNEAIFVEAMPLRGMSSKPLFDHWQNKTYAQVLENFWKPWGILLFEIMKDPEHPLSYLIDGNGDLIPMEKIDLPS